MASEIQDCLEAMLAVLELKSSSPPFNLFQLDETIVRQILSYLSFKQRMVLRLVCHSFNKAEQKIWHSTVSVNLQLEIERIFPRRQGYACRYIWYLPRLAKVLSLVCNLTLRRISFARPTRSLWHMTNFLDPQLMAIFFSGNWASVTELDLTGCAVAEGLVSVEVQLLSPRTQWIFRNSANADTNFPKC